MRRGRQDRLLCFHFWICSTAPKYFYGIMPLSRLVSSCWPLLDAHAQLACFGIDRTNCAHWVEGSVLLRVRWDFWFWALDWIGLVCFGSECMEKRSLVLGFELGFFSLSQGNWSLWWWCCNGLWGLFLFFICVVVVVVVVLVCVGDHPAMRGAQFCSGVVSLGCERLCLGANQFRSPSGLNWRSCV